MIENESLARSVYLVLFHLNKVMNALDHVSTSILIEALLDCLNRKYDYEDEWDVVDLTQRMNNPLVQPVHLAADREYATRTFYY